MNLVLEEFLLLHVLTRIEKRYHLCIPIHHTSMIHNAVGVAEHCSTLRELREIADKFNSLEQKECKKKLINIADKYYPNYAKLAGMKKTVGGLNSNEFREIFNEIEFIELNRRDEEIDETIDLTGINLEEFEQELDYYPIAGGEGKSYIITGGARISRGLTLEGLTITCFSRRAINPNYDTMLQMARWCGYRDNYEELVRIITTPTIADDYRVIHEAESHMRRQMKNLTDNDDPVDKVIWIKMSDDMNISGRLPTKQFRQVVEKYNNYVYRETWTQQPPELSSGTNNAYAEFWRLYNQIGVGNLGEPPKKEGGFLFCQDVNHMIISRFLSGYIKQYTSDCPQKEQLTSILDITPDYQEWNVALYNPCKNPDATYQTITPSLMFNLARRTPNNKKSISQVYSGYDTTVEIDLAKDKHGNIEERIKPLLVLVLANHDSNYSDGTRCYPKAKLPIVTFGIILPMDNLTQNEIDKYMRGHRNFAVPHPKF